jgi:hypothetical protein
MISEIKKVTDLETDAVNQNYCLREAFIALKSLSKQ